MGRSLRHPGRVLGLVLTGALLNLVPIALPGEAYFFLGPFVTMPLVLLLPMPWSVLAAAVPMAVTIPLLGHPFPFLLATCEAWWLAVALGRRQHAAILQDALFWGVAGLPAVIALSSGVARLPPDLVAIVAGKQIFNQLAAVALAVFLLRHTRLGTWLEDRQVARRRMRDMVSHAVFMLAVVPLVLLGIGVSVLLWAYCEREDREVLGKTAQHFAQQLDMFLSAHEATVTSLANTLSRGGAEGTALLEEVRQAQPAFITMLVADRTGRITHCAPQRGPDEADLGRVDDREYFRHARTYDRPYVSEVFRGRGFGRDLLVAISAPVHDAEGKFAGVVEASLEVHHFARLIVGAEPKNAPGLIFADRTGRVIFSSDRVGLPPLALLRHQAQGDVVAAALAGQAPSRRFDLVGPGGGKTRLTAFVTRAAESGVIVVAQRPLLAGLEGSGWIFVLFGMVAAGIVAGAVIIARGARRRTATSLEFFATDTSRQAALRTVAPITCDLHDAPYEVWMVFRAFNQLAVQLQGTYAILRQSNADLDRRVIERTAEADAARRQAEAASQSKTDFLAMTGHEIRTPLNAIIGLADSLQGTVREPEAAARLRTIRHAGQRLLGVVNDLLDLSRVEAGKLELHLAPVALGELCREVQALFALRACEQGLELAVEFNPTEPLWLETDGARLQQVLINLVGNALKFTRAGRVCLRVDEEHDGGTAVTLRFAVSDTGPGIPAEQQARLFQPYVQLPGARQSAVPGTGLGLAISRRFVELFGGQLALNSREGAGAEFHFTLTLRRAAPPVAVVAVAEEPAPGALRLLAADDNLANQEVLRSMLERHCEPLVIVDGAEAALAELERTAFDVALIDLEMPDADGFSVARAVRAWRGVESSRGCRLVAFSAHGRDEVWPRCAASGFDDYVEKPINRQQMMRALRGRPIAHAA